MDNSDPVSAMRALSDALKADPGYAWAWHCNLSMPIMDATGCSGELANQAGAHLMHHLFGIDITQHRYWEGTKSPAQEYAELRIAAEREEDDATPEQPA